MIHRFLVVLLSMLGSSAVIATQIVPSTEPSVTPQTNGMIIKLTRRLLTGDTSALVSNKILRHYSSQSLQATDCPNLAWAQCGGIAFNVNFFYWFQITSLK